MAGEHIYSPDSLLLILEQVTLLHTVFETVLPKSLRQQTRELLSLAIAVVHQLEIREMLVKEYKEETPKTYSDFEPVFNACSFTSQEVCHLRDIAWQLSLINLNEFRLFILIIQGYSNHL